MKSNKTKSAMTALVIAAMICTAAMPVKAEESKWVNNEGNWSLIKADGKKATGWVKDGDCWYAFDENGSMRTGWVASHEHWYFMGQSGVMQVNTVVEDNGAKYYVKGTGVMAKDYVKDGYEFTSDGKAIPLSESKSVVLTDAAELEGKVIEGNLYVDITTAKEIELKGVTVKGKLVIVGDNETKGKLTLTDSTVETINTQSRNSEVVLSGDTEVKKIVIEETAKVTTDKDYKGKVENFEIQSTAKGEIVVEVPAENVSTNSYAPVDIQAPVENLEVKTETEVKVNADVKNVTVTETAKDTTVEVGKGSTVGTITADAPVKIDGKGTVDKVEANVDGVEAGKDTTIKEVETGKDVTEAPDATKPDKGGSSGSSGGGDYTPTSVTYNVTDESTFLDALSKAEARDTIKLENSISVDTNVFATAYVNNNVKASITVDLNNLTLTLTGNKSIVYANKSLAFKNGNIVANNYDNGTDSVFNPEYNASIKLSNVKMNTNGSALYPRGNAARVDVIDSEITAGVYAIGTNANGLENYGVVINVLGSTLNTTGWIENDGDDCAVMINVAGTLNITDSTLNGNRQGLVVRAGEATVKNTVINYSGNWANIDSRKNEYYNSGWGSGNNLPSAPVVVGSRNNGTVYKAPATLTLNGCTINGSNNVTIVEETKEVQVYMYGRVEYHATLNIENPENEQIYKVVQGEMEYTTVTGLSTQDEEIEPTPIPQEKTEEELKENSEENKQTGSTDDSTSENNDVSHDLAAE